MNIPALGIDISKGKFNVCLINVDGKLRHNQFLNTAAGFDHLAAWLTKQKFDRVHACMEATGTYDEALAHYLHAAGHRVSVLNPAAVKAFAASQLSRTKTDRVDAELIARFCTVQQPPAWTPPAAEVRELQALVRRLEALIEMRTAEGNRLEAASTASVVRASIEAHLAYLDAETLAHRATRPRAHRQPSAPQTAERVARLDPRHRRDDRRRDLSRGC